MLTPTDVIDHAKNPLYPPPLVLAEAAELSKNGKLLRRVEKILAERVEKVFIIGTFAEL